ncbi:PulJ/GspJ family protein, partial [Fangia hongkongensis]
MENRKQQLGISLIEVALSISIFSLTIIMVLKTFNFQQNQNDIIDTTVQKVQAVIAVANALQSGGYYPSEKTLDTYFSQRNININLN